MLAYDDIQKYGGKAAILNHVKEKIPSMPIPSYIIKLHSDTLDNILPEFESLHKPVIVRSSSPYEYSDFEGIFESVRDVNTKQQFIEAIKTVENSAVSERATAYAKQNGFNIDEKISVILQEQSPSTYTGAMMRHPNNPNTIFIQYFLGHGQYTQVYGSFIFSEEGNLELGCSSASKLKDEKRFLIDKYKELEALTDITKDETLFVEFGLEPFAIYQVRPFKKKQTAEFELPKYSDDTLYSDVVFGITPKDGIVLPVIRGIGLTDGKLLAKALAFGDDSLPFENYDSLLKMQLMNVGMMNAISGGRNTELSKDVNYELKQFNSNMNELIKEPYCYIATSAHRDEYDVDLTLTKMRALALGETSTFLVHNLIRLLKKSDVSLLREPPLIGFDTYKNIKSIEDKVRIISNGKEAIILKE